MKSITGETTSPLIPKSTMGESTSRESECYLSAVNEHIESDMELPHKDLEAQMWSVLDHAADAQRRGFRVYKSLQNLNEVIGTEYGDRVLYELIQNAHDAHDPGDKGRIAIRLVIQSETEGVLYVANGGRGFRREDVEAIKNLATSAKEIGEGIGNKGLGFRSIEALSDDVQIYSRRSAQRTERFDGYCFRFATAEEIEDIAQSNGINADTAREVAKTVPRYLVPRPLQQQPDEVVSYARRDYATVIVAPLRTADAVDLASRQVKALVDLEVPLLLFLDRIAEFRVAIDTPDKQTYRRRLSRSQKALGEVQNLADCRMYEVGVGRDKRFLVVRREVDKERVLKAVERSILKAPQLKRWLAWKGQPVVSVAVGLSADAVTKGCLYNFLPMGDEAASPLIGYLNAPFFADINRRNADLDLPLNNTLMEAVAETCSAAALSIVKQDTRVPQRAVFDLVAWTGDQAEKLDNALEKTGSSLREVPVIPAIAVGRKKNWTSIGEASIWPQGTFTLLKAKEVAKRVGAQLVSTKLDSDRLDRLREVAERIFRSLSPSNQLGEWLEHFAQSLIERKAAPRTWSQFYEDVNLVFDKTNADLESLSGKSILYDRSGKLSPAGKHDGTSWSGVFVRIGDSKRRRDRGSAPLPPSTLTRRYRFLEERIIFRPETLNAFIKANLIREYDPIEALAGLKSVLGQNTSENRRKEALQWAFKVWRTASASGHIEEELQKADLHVPTQTGWQPATRAAFSASWTRVGQTLETFLVEAAEVSPDCRRAFDVLLVGFREWPAAADEAKKHWVRFLKIIGVADGLRPVSARMKRKGSPRYHWNYLLYSGEPTEGLDKDWCIEVAEMSFNHPYTEYCIKGEAWRLPGQLEHEKLTSTAKEAFCELVFEHLKACDDENFTFEIGRFDRYYRDWDLRKLPTPLATFLRSKPWIAADTRDGLGFRRVRECWASRVRRGGPPKFMDRVHEATIADLAEEDQLAELAFGEDLRFRDWQSPNTAVDRLRDLAAICPTLISNERPTFRREYQRVWADVVKAGVTLPADLSLAVNRRGRIEELRGDAAERPNVIVAENAQRFEARILSSSGQAVLDLGDDTSTEKVADLLDETGVFVARRLDGIGVKLLVDDEPFVPSTTDPLLTSSELSWLPEVIALGHELLGEQLERGIQSTTVDRRVRTIRVRRCEAVALVVDKEVFSPTETITHYPFEHETLPTLILTNSLTLDWKILAQLSGPISRLIDSRLRFLEPLLLRLALDHSDALDAPSDRALAEALKCDVQTVQEHRDALRTDLGHILHLLVPVVAYLKDAELARQIQGDADREGTKLNVADWLRVHLTGTAIAPQDLINACERASDRAVLRRDLDLDYAKFNRVLRELGEPLLSNEAELRQFYDAYLAQRHSEIIERLRRCHFDDFRDELDLVTYVERKTLKFLLFDPEWILTRETLEMEIVKAHVSGLLDEILGEDRAVELPALGPLIEKNRRSVREFSMYALPIIKVWCHRNMVSEPEPWKNSDPQSVVRHLENCGLLDFGAVSSEQLPSLCRRATCWPNGMPETLDSTTLGLNKTELEEEEKRRKQERDRKEIERRSIDFAGRSLDTSDPSFAETLRQLAEERITGDDTWFERSRQQPRLVEFDTDQTSTGGRRSSVNNGGRRRREKPTDTQLQAMGLASEWLAFQYLQRRHGEFVNETCWISENRARFFGGDEGDDAAGYDFCVKTPSAEWLYEVKSSWEDTHEFELTANELRVASSASKDGRRRYRILYVPFVFSPEKWFVLELPNPMGEATRNRFKVVGQGAVRLKFEKR